MHDFKWLIPDVLAGGHHPLLNKNFNLTDDTDWYSKKGIKSVISIFESPIPKPIINSVPWDYTFVATRDGQAPKNLYSLCKSISSNNPCFVHCFAGIGRTGTVLTAYLLYTGNAHKVKDAIQKVRKIYDPGAVHTPDQYLALLEFNNESKTIDETEEEIEELFKKKRREPYTEEEAYKKIHYLNKKGMDLIKDKFGADSPEYKYSRRKFLKLQEVLER